MDAVTLWKAVEGDLMTLSAEARRALPVVKDAAERVVYDTRGIQSKDGAAGLNALTNDVLASLRTQWLQPFVFACNHAEAPAKLISIAVAAIQRMVTTACVNHTDLPSIARVLEIQADNPSEDVRRRVLSTLPLLLSNPAAAPDSKLLAQVMSLCFYFLRDKPSSSSSSTGSSSQTSQSLPGGSTLRRAAVAALQQTVAAMFDRAEKDLQLLGIPAAIAAAEDGTPTVPVSVSVPPSSVLCACRLFLQDMCLITGGMPTQWMKRGTAVPRTLAADFLELAVRDHPRLFIEVPPFASLAAGLLIPLLMRQLPSQASFPLALRFFRISRFVLVHLHTAIQPHCRALLSLLVRMVHASANGQDLGADAVVKLGRFGAAGARILTGAHRALGAEGASGAAVAAGTFDAGPAATAVSATTAAGGHGATTHDSVFAAGADEAAMLAAVAAIRIEALPLWKCALLGETLVCITSHPAVVVSLYATYDAQAQRLPAGSSTGQGQAQGHTLGNAGKVVELLLVALQELIGRLASDVASPSPGSRARVGRWFKAQLDEGLLGGALAASGGSVTGRASFGSSGPSPGQSSAALPGEEVMSFNSEEMDSGSRGEFDIHPGEIDAACDYHRLRPFSGLACPDQDVHVYTSSAGGIAQAISAAPVPQQLGGAHPTATVTVGGLAAAAVGGAFSLFASGTSLLAGAVSGSKDKGAEGTDHATGGDSVNPPAAHPAQLFVLCVEAVCNIAQGAIYSAGHGQASGKDEHNPPLPALALLSGTDSVHSASALHFPSLQQLPRNKASSFVSCACKPVSACLLLALDKCEGGQWADLQQLSTLDENQGDGATGSSGHAQLATLPCHLTSALPLAALEVLQSLAVASITNAGTAQGPGKSRGTEAANVESVLTALCRAAVPGWAPMSVLAMLAPEERPRYVVSPSALTPRHAVAVRCIFNVAHQAGQAMAAQAWALVFECLGAVGEFCAAARIAAGQGVGLRADRPGASVLQSSAATASNLLSNDVGGPGSKPFIEQLREGDLSPSLASAPLNTSSSSGSSDGAWSMMSRVRYELYPLTQVQAFAKAAGSRKSFGNRRSFSNSTALNDSDGDVVIGVDGSVIRRGYSGLESNVTQTASATPAVHPALEADVAGIEVALRHLVACTAHLSKEALCEVVSALSELTVTAFAESATAELGAKGGIADYGFSSGAPSTPGPVDSGRPSVGKGRTASRIPGGGTSGMASMSSPDTSFTMEALAADEAREFVARDRQTGAGASAQAVQSVAKGLEANVALLGGSVNTGAAVRPSATLVGPVTPGGPSGAGSMSAGASNTMSATAAAPFPLARLVEVAGANLWRLDTIWQPVAAILRVLARSTSPNIRAFGLSMLSNLAIAVITSVGTAPAAGVKASQGSLPSAESLLSPLADFWRSPFASTRADCLRCAHRTVEEAGKALAAQGIQAHAAWCVLLSLLHCVACMGVGIEPTGYGLELNIIPVSSGGTTEVEDVQGTGCLQYACEALHSAVLECRDSHAGSLYAARPALLAEAFRTVQLLCDDFSTTLPAHAMALLLLDLSLFARQAVEPNLALTAVNLLWRIGEALAQQRAIHSGVVNADVGYQPLTCLVATAQRSTDTLYQTLWYGVFSTLLTLCNDSDGARLPVPADPSSPSPSALRIAEITLTSRMRPDVRNSAVQALFSAVTSHGRHGVMNDAQWSSVFPGSGALLDLVLKLTTVAQENLACDAPVVGETVGRRRAGLANAWTGPDAGEEAEEDSGNKGALVRLPVHHTRDTVGKQWSETRCLVYQGCTRLLTDCFRRIAALPWFRESWEAILAVLQTSVTGRVASSSDGGVSLVMEPTDVSVTAIGCLADLALVVVVPAGPAAPADAEAYSLDMRVVDGALVHTSGNKEMAASSASSAVQGGKAKASPGTAGSVSPALRDALWRDVQTSLSGLVDSPTIHTDEEEAVGVALLDALFNVAIAASPVTSTDITAREQGGNVLSTSTAETSGRFGYLLALVWNILDGRRFVRWSSANSATSSGALVSAEELAGPKIDTSTNLERALLRGLERCAAALCVLETRGQPGCTSQAWTCLLEVTRRIAVLDDACYASAHARGAAPPMLPPMPTVVQAAESAVKGAPQGMSPASPAQPHTRAGGRSIVRGVEEGREGGACDLALPPSSLAVSAVKFLARLYVSSGRPEVGHESNGAGGGEALQRALSQSFGSTVSMLATHLLRTRETAEKCTSALDQYAAMKAGKATPASTKDSAASFSGANATLSGCIARSAVPSLGPLLENASAGGTGTGKSTHTGAGALSAAGMGIVNREAIYPIKIWGFGLGGGYGSGTGKDGSTSSALPLSVADINRAKRSAARAVTYAQHVQATLVIAVQHGLWASAQIEITGGSESSSSSASGGTTGLGALEVAIGLLGTVERLLQWPTAHAASAQVSKSSATDPYADIAHFTEKVSILLTTSADQPITSSSDSASASAATVFASAHKLTLTAVPALAGISDPGMSSARYSGLQQSPEIVAALRSVGWEPLSMASGQPASRTRGRVGSTQSVAGKAAPFHEQVNRAVLQAAGLTAGGGTASSGSGASSLPAGPPLGPSTASATRLDAEVFLLSSVIDYWRKCTAVQSMCRTQAYVTLTKRLLALLTAGCTSLWTWPGQQTRHSTSTPATGDGSTLLLSGLLDAQQQVPADGEARLRSVGRVCTLAFMQVASMLTQEASVHSYSASDSASPERMIQGEVASYARCIVLHTLMRFLFSMISLEDSLGGPLPSACLLDAWAVGQMLAVMASKKPLEPSASAPPFLVKLMLPAHDKADNEAAAGAKVLSTFLGRAQEGSEWAMLWSTACALVRVQEGVLRYVASTLLSSMGPGSAVWSLAHAAHSSDSVDSRGAHASVGTGMGPRRPSGQLAGVGPASAHAAGTVTRVSRRNTEESGPTHA